MEIFINCVGLAAINIMAILSAKILDKNFLLAVILLFLGNFVGGMMYKYKEEE